VRSATNDQAVVAKMLSVGNLSRKPLVLALNGLVVVPLGTRAVTAVKRPLGVIRHALPPPRLAHSTILAGAPEDANPSRENALHGFIPHTGATVFHPACRTMLVEGPNGTHRPEGTCR
jgi:hypothetical protein